MQSWKLWEAGYVYDTVRAPSARAALKIAIDNVDIKNYSHMDDYGRTTWIDVRVECEATGEAERATVQLDPTPPKCARAASGKDRDRDHDWKSPHSVVGGDRTNPGVFGSGAGIKVREVCRFCGVYRLTDTWSTRPDTGEQGLTSVSYEEADEASHAWVQSMTPESDSD
jgi:hypothetical protein